MSTPPVMMGPVAPAKVDAASVLLNTVEAEVQWFATGLFDAAVVVSDALAGHVLPARDGDARSIGHVHLPASHDTSNTQQATRPLPLPVACCVPLAAI
jgi:hypothetical protein